MTTLLLTFFVMLLTLAQEQDSGYTGIGQYTEARASFSRAISSLGLGIIYSEKQGPDFGNIKPKYDINNPDSQFAGRTIDAKEEDIRRIFQKLSRSMKTTPSHIVGERTNFSVTDIRFPPGDVTLNEPAKMFLTKFSSDLQQDPDSKFAKLYVLGLAGDESTEKGRWILSARRAQVAADFLQDLLPSRANWPVYSWGAGPGGDWVSRHSPISGQSQILIAVLRSK
jgi:outer membrane protein OmpA-like peptidoglycan-associated protein